MAIPVTIRIIGGSFDPEAETRIFRAQMLSAGALVTFTGQVRDDSGAETRITLEHYPGFTENEIARHCAAAQSRWTLLGLLIIHRVGVMAPGEPIVLVATAAKHRREAFSAADFLMDYLKSRAPFWKKEASSNGDRWIEPRAEDIADLRRWD